MPAVWGRQSSVIGGVIREELLSDLDCSSLLNNTVCAPQSMPSSSNLSSAEEQEDAAFAAMFPSKDV